MLNPKHKTTRTIRSAQVLSAFVMALHSRLSLQLQGTRITEGDILYVLGHASAQQISIEAACNELDEAPSGNRLREVLLAALPERSVMQRQLNTILRQQLPKTLLKGKRSYNLAIDLTLIPYHGQAQQNEEEIRRGQAKSGTTHFHAYATVSIVHSKRRYVVALFFVEKGETMVEVVRRTLNRVKRLGIRVRRVYLDKAFCAVEVFRTLDRRKLSYVVPIPKRGKSGGVRRLFSEPRSYATTYTISSQEHGDYTVQAVALRRYSKGKYGRHGVQWFAYAVAGLPARMQPRQVFELYRQRFGIETSYRQMNEVRARTSSRNPILRLLLVGIAFILVNLYVTSREEATPCPNRQKKPWLSLRRMARMLARAVEKHFGIAAVFQLRPVSLFS